MNKMEKSDDYTCGLGKFRPRFLQRFANSKTFMFIYGLLGTTQAMAFVYFVSTLTTLEKRFQIPSQVTGTLMSGNEVSQILLSMFLSYRGGKGNRPLWMAWGVLFSSISCFILAIPHWIYGPGNHALALTKEYIDYDFLNSSHGKKESGANPNLCSTNGTSNENCTGMNFDNSIVPLALIFFSQFVLGIGTTLYVTLGQPYLDDNINKKNTPLLIGITMAFRSAGPAVGFVLGYLCLNIYVNPSLNPVIQRKDPRWIGAWWLVYTHNLLRMMPDVLLYRPRAPIRWIILGSVMTIFSLLLALFPKKLRRKNIELEPLREKKHSFEMHSLMGKNTQKVVSTEQTNTQKSKEVGFKDFRRAVTRILTNPLLISNNLCAVFYILGASGYFNFYNKYLETQFHSSAASASMFAGVTTVSSMMIGFVAAGLIITKVRPRTSYLLAWNIIVGLLYMVGELVFIFISCEENPMEGSLTNIGILNPKSECNANCFCASINYSPVCYEKSNQTFFSPCHAGCSDMANYLGQTIYSNCSCLFNDKEIVHPGPCNVDCFSTLLIFIGTQSLIQLIGCSGRITTVLVNYRSIEARDKELAQGLALFMISLFAFIPGPIIYGKIIDSTCLVWDNKCGKRGNCWIYDKSQFRLKLNSVALCFTFGAVFFDIVVWYLGRNLKLYEDNKTEAKN